MTYSNESVSAALGALSCQRDLEKQGFLEPVVGGAIGAYKSPRGSRLDGAGHGVVTGLGTGLGAGVLGGVGALGGSALGPAGSIAGLLAGLGAGGYGGFRASNAMQRSLRGGPLPYDADFEPKEKSEEKKEKTKDGDGDGKVNDGTPEEKQAFTVPKTPRQGLYDNPNSVPSKKTDAMMTSMIRNWPKDQAARQVASDGPAAPPMPTGPARPVPAPALTDKLWEDFQTRTKAGPAAPPMPTGPARRGRLGSGAMQNLGFGKSGSARPHAENRLQNIKLASTILNMHAIGQELAACNLHQLSKSAAVGAHKEERMKAAALIRQYELEKQALLPGIARLVARSPRR